MPLNQKELRDENYWKATAKVNVNIALIGVSFTVFALMITLKPEFLASQVLTLQIVLAIPFLISSTLARLRHIHAKGIEQYNWEHFGYACFILAYGFLINAIGILLSKLTTPWVTELFFAVNIALSLLYSVIEVYYERRKLLNSLVKDVVFVGIIVLLGIVPALSV